MTQKMILMPVERVKALENLTTDNKRPLPPDIEVKLMQQDKAQRRKSPQSVKKQADFDGKDSESHAERTSRANSQDTVTHVRSQRPYKIRQKQRRDSVRRSKSCRFGRERTFVNTDFQQEKKNHSKGVGSFYDVTERYGSSCRRASGVEVVESCRKGRLGSVEK